MIFVYMYLICVMILDHTTSFLYNSRMICIIYFCKCMVNFFTSTISLGLYMYMLYVYLRLL
jgi:hypothetical protein